MSMGQKNESSIELVVANMLCVTIWLLKMEAGTTYNILKGKSRGKF